MLGIGRYIQNLRCNSLAERTFSGFHLTQDTVGKGIPGPHKYLLEKGESDFLVVTAHTYPYTLLALLGF